MVVAKASDFHPRDAEFPPSGIDDMTKLANLHEPGVLYNLKCRYDINEIYTYTGYILIAVNPFQRLPHLYDNHMMEQYKGVALGELSPHPFAIADSAYRQMINEGISQSILVSGESGAGKTESTKLLMCYLAYMGGRTTTEKRSVEQQALESNPVLEVFGNAKTLRNNNSRSAIRTYLLERSRVCQVSDPERNYHCFYMLCAAPNVIHQKTRVSYDEIANDLCPLYRICTLYWDDYNTQSVSPEVISSMKVLMTEDSTGDDSKSFLLDDDSSGRFSLTTHEKDISDVKAAAEPVENPAFQFLQH